MTAEKIMVSTYPGPPCIAFYNGGPISWTSKKQSNVALSTMESEFVAATEAVKEIIYLTNLIEELTSSKPYAKLLLDNTSTIDAIKNGSFTTRTKHISLAYNFIFDEYKKERFVLEFCPTEIQIANMLTKHQPKPRFDTLKDRCLTTLVMGEC